MKKSFLTMLFLAILFASIPNESRAASVPYSIDTSLLDYGIVTINEPDEQDEQALVRITKDHINYDYVYTKGAQYPLQLGNGEYTVLVAVMVSGSTYKVAAQSRIDLKMENENAVFLQSIPLVNWNEETKAVVEAKKLTADAASDTDKIAAIYSYIINHIQYDFDKAQTIEQSYLPDLDNVYETSRGICYDYAAIFAAMARSVGIPTRLVMGYETEHPDTYHAWNQVYLNDEWVTVDTTYDSARVQSGQDTPMLKNADNYIVKKIY